MKRVLLFALALPAMALAAEGARTAPSPRIRLDAMGRAAASAPVTDVEAAPREGVTVLQPVVVREKTLGSGPTQPPPPEKFSALEGGTMLRRDVGGVRLEVGLWPHASLIPWEPSTRPPGSLFRAAFLSVSW